MSKIVHSSDNENFYLNQRNVRDYEAMRGDVNGKYLIELYYSQNKSITSLRQIIVSIEDVQIKLCENYCCVVDTKSEDKKS